jgi:diguanylate cyclase (GGDEF)-like protein
LLYGAFTTPQASVIEQPAHAVLNRTDVAGADQTGEHRDRTAEDRDQRADDHDQASEARDARAAARDERAEARELAADGMDSGAAADRAGALRDRRGGASDRIQAADDREAASADRLLAARERADFSIDELTGATGRKMGMVELKREMARSKRMRKPFSLVFVDVDELKGTNDSRGHAAGDEVLHTTADTIRAHLRSYDLVIRFGGDEFLCGLPDVAMEDAVKRFALVNADLVAIQGASITVGVAQCEPDDTLDGLIARADEAMYRERRQRRSAGG